MVSPISMRSALRILALAAAPLPLDSLAQAQTVYQDGDFASWTSVYRGHVGSSAAMEVLPTGGNPDACISATTVTGPLGFLLMWSPLLEWDFASQGPLLFLDFQVDVRSISCWGQGQGIRPLLLQGGRFFLSTDPYFTYLGTPPCEWFTMEFPTLLESDFMWVPDVQFALDLQPEGCGPPDFGPDAPPIQLGFVISNRSSNIYEQLYDNWRMTLTPAASYSPGEPFCAGDGSGGACPCDNENDGSAGVGPSGCANGSFSGGARLVAEGSHSLSGGGLGLSVTGSVPHRPGLFFQGDEAVAGGDGVPFGDGLRCAGSGVVRLEIASADAGGSVSSTRAIAARGGVECGDVKAYQWWYRDPAGSACGTSFNLSNGVMVSWGP